MLVIRRLFGTGTNCIAPSGLPLLLCLFPGLAPWAFLSRPCGASFAPETSLRQSEGDQGITKTVVVFVASTRRDDDKLLAGLEAFDREAALSPRNGSLEECAAGTGRCLQRRALPVS